MTVEYSIEFYSYWHCGSGLAAGADVDSLVVKDKHGMPYIPGKTIKGLLRESVEEVLTLLEKTESYMDSFTTLFGFSNSESYKEDIESQKRSSAFFSNAELMETEYKAIVSNNMASYMFKSVSSTSIDKNGIAKDHSLRKTEVVLPCKLYGKITGVPEDLYDILTTASGMIKCMGTSRSRGLGRCTLSISRKEEAL